MNPTYRQAIAADHASLARLRWASIVEEKSASPQLGFQEFQNEFANWASRNALTHLPFVAEVAGEIVGMAWLAVQARVPSPRAVDRSSGDVQSVYIDPALRNRGIGLGLLRLVLESAAHLGVERVTVHSSERAVHAYQRAGFKTSSLLLHASP